MSVKLNFKLDRSKFVVANMNVFIKNELEKCFTEKGILISRVYDPSYKYIKVLLNSESVVEKVFDCSEYFTSKGFEPNLTIQLRTARTVFCYGFDISLLEACDPETIKQALIEVGWEVSNVYVLQSKRSMKIEFKSRSSANKFLEVKAINVCGIRLENHQIEPEVDPSIDQCYNCGIIEPGHTREQCQHRPCCMRCGYEGHLFFQCELIPNISPSDYSEYHNNQAYCISCRAANGHCSLNHRACPVKKNIIKNRILENRSNRAYLSEEKNKESELGKQIAIELANINEWPTVKAKPNIPEPSLAMSAIITLAMVEEAQCQGSFQAGLDKACDANNFPKFKYELNHEAAVMVVKNLSANPGAVVTFPTPYPYNQSMGQFTSQVSASQPISSPHNLIVSNLTSRVSASQPIPSPHNQTMSHLANQIGASQPISLQSTSHRYIRDMRKQLAANNADTESDSNVSEGSKRNKRARYSPNKTTNVGPLNDIRNRLEEQTYIINVENHSHIGAGIEEIEVKDLLKLYEKSNSELSATRRNIIEALLSQAVEMDSNMNIHANIIRVGEDFH